MSLRAGGVDRPPLSFLWSADAGGERDKLVDPDEKDPKEEREKTAAPGTHEGPPSSQDDPVAPGGTMPPRKDGEGV